jgi:hypothetical protein
MPKWLDEIEAQEAKETSAGRKVAAAVLVALAVAVAIWQLAPRSAPPPPPPPSTDVYRAAFDEVASAAYVENRLEIVVDKRWNALERPERSERIVALLERTGSFEFERIVVRDTDGLIVATVDAEGAIRWVE